MLWRAIAARKAGAPFAPRCPSHRTDQFRQRPLRARRTDHAPRVRMIAPNVVRHLRAVRSIHRSLSAVGPVRRGDRLGSLSVRLAVPKLFRCMTIAKPLRVGADSLSSLVPGVPSGLAVPVPLQDRSRRPNSDPICLPSGPIFLPKQIGLVLSVAAFQLPTVRLSLHLRFVCRFPKNSPNAFSDAAAGATVVSSV